MMIKRITAIIAALTLSVSMLASCGNTDSSSQTDAEAVSQSSESTDAAESGDSAAADGEGSSDAAAGSDAGDSAAADSKAVEIPDPSLTIDGEKIDTKDIVMCTVEGEDIGFDMFRYYYYYLMNNMMMTPETVASDEEAFKNLKDAIIMQLKRDYTTVRLAKENNIVLDDAAKKEVEDQLASMKENYGGEEGFAKALKESYLTEAVYTRMLEIAKLYSLVESQLLTNEGKYATKEDDFRKIVKDTDKYSRVIHILVPYHSQAEITDEETKSSYENMSLAEKSSAKQAAYNALSDEEKEKVKEASKKVAEEVLQKAKDGDDFSELIKEYGWDPGMETHPEGYYINKNTNFVEEFKTKAFELKENEISDLVENENYGWFIIKRLPVDMDYVDEKIKDMILEYDTPTINEMFNKLVEEIEFKESEYMEKLKPGSIT